MNAIGEYAKRYLALGFNVVPLEAAKKTPLPSFKLETYFSKKVTEADLDVWFQASTNHNIAIITGKISGIFVVDIDGDEAKHYLKSKLESFSDNLQSSIAYTMASKTGKGAHLIFRFDVKDYPEGVKTQKIWLGKANHCEIMIKGEGGYIVAPPSIHPDTGQPYILQHNAEPHLLSKKQIEELIRILSASAKPRIINPHNNNDTSNNALTPEKMSHLLETLAPYYTKGNRDQLVFNLAGYMRKQNISLDNAERMISLLAEKTGDEEQHNRLIVVRRTYEQPLEQIIGYSGMLEIIALINGNDKRTTTQTLSRLKEIIENNNSNGKSEVDTGALYEINELAGVITDLDDTTDIAYTVGNTIMRQIPVKTIIDTKEVYYYEEKEGIWCKNGEQFIEKIIKENGLKLSKHEISEVIYHIQTSTYIDRDQFFGCIIDNLVHVQNGWLNMDTLELSPHTPERLSLGKFPTEHKRMAGGEFARTVMAALDVNYARRLFKVMGNILIPDCRYEKVALFIGEGHNRKGTIIAAIEETIGLENCAHVSLQEFADDKFASAELYGKMLNCVADLNAKKLSNTGRFKEIVSGDSIRAQEKNIPAFTYKNKAKLLYSANEIPPSDDQSYAFFRRWEIIPFYRTFDRDPTIQERLKTEDERSGILNIMLWGRKRLIEEGFDETPIERIRQMYNKSASVNKDFLDEACVIDIQSDYEIKSESLQQSFFEYIEKKKGKKLSKSDKNFLIRQLGAELEKLGIDHKQRGPRTSREYYYLGITTKAELTKHQTTLG